MPQKLKPEEVVTLRTLKGKGQSNCQIARTLGVTEGAVRYHVRRNGQQDGRRAKTPKAEQVAVAIDAFVQDHEQRQATRPVNVTAMYDWLRSERAYEGSYKSVLRYVRGKYPQPKLRPFRRVETPPGAQAQVDWGEVPSVDLGDGPQKIYAFVMTLSHCRKTAVIWCRRMDQLSWHHAHNEAFRRLAGIAAVLRIDNLKTGIIHGAGPWGEINTSYRAYARSVGFHVDACLPRAPEHKGKVENRVGQVKRQLDLTGKQFDGLADLQGYSDEQLGQTEGRQLCPATGHTVHETWLEEQRVLAPLPVLPEIFDVAVTRPVQRDCTVAFEGRTYSVPFRLCRLQVEVRGCCGVVQMLHDGQVVAEHPRGTERRLLIDPAHYEGEGDERVTPPMPLGKMGRKLQEIMAQPVEHRPLALYAALAEVAR